MPDTFTKRQKSRDRQDRQREKAAKRAQKKQTEVGRPETANGEDPDIAGIVPGPQPEPIE